MVLLHRLSLLTLILFTIFTSSYAQKKTTEDKFYEQYNKNIKKSRINGVYIPKNLNEVYLELKGLSSPQATSKFKLGEERIVGEKLKLGLGRWIFVNWNFYEGSRLSHYLKMNYGLSHPEDMSKFLIICYHRHLNKKEIFELKLAKTIKDERRKMLIDRHIIRGKN